MVTSESR